ncbi:MAG: hypothetical protein DWQ36_13730 [Acidobacteria bacterium]|nr:MAG: hypothetical protein DWQ30_20225 [Acidobacteriota bacterium]REK06269.1 MAG: hypothetical protein DWQ36_13730 [Acidobacteriota bacterium]
MNGVPAAGERGEAGQSGTEPTWRAGSPARRSGVTRTLLALAAALLSHAACGRAPDQGSGSPAVQQADGAASSTSTPSGGATHLFVWSADADSEDSDFLAVIDARVGEPTYGDVVATLPVGAAGTMPHHMQYEFPTNGRLFANGWHAGRTFVVDVSDPLAPILAASFEQAAGFSYPHSFAQLPDGRVLATFQTVGGSQVPPGGLVELTADGEAIRAVSSRTPEIDDDLNWPYSLVVLPEIDRAVSTSADMGFHPMDEWEYHYTRHVQIWELGSLELLASVPLPEGPVGEYHFAPAEPRRLRDGTVYVSTFGCGLYRLDDITTSQPSAVFVHAFPGSLTPGEECFVPVVVGRYWVQTAAALPGLVVLDVGDPTAPREVARLELDAELYPVPHWIAADRGSGRLVVAGNNETWVLVVEIDPESGALNVDGTFGAPGADVPGIRFDRDEWPHGSTGPAWVHGALFGG